MCGSVVEDSCIKLKAFERQLATVVIIYFIMDRHNPYLVARIEELGFAALLLLFSNVMSFSCMLNVSWHAFPPTISKWPLAQST
jgi:hypothetical protein